MTPEEHKRLSVFYTHTELNATTFTEPVLVLWYPDVQKYGVTSFPKQYVGKIFKYVYVARGVPTDVYKKYWVVYLFKTGLKLPYSFKRQEEAEAFAERITYPIQDHLSFFLDNVLKEWCLERNIQWKDRFFQ